jgi:transcriptional regulator with XRE-family HTH domain
MFRGADLLALRERRGVSRGAVSGRAGISRFTVSRLESNLRMPAIDSLAKLAESGTYSLVNQLLL